MIELISNAKKVFLSSAKINRHTEMFLEYVEKLTGQKCKYIKNMYMPQKDRVYYFAEERGQIDAKIEELVKQEKRILIATDSYKESEVIRKLIISLIGDSK